MLFRTEFLEGIVAGDITVAFRRWKRATAKAGGRQLTKAGLLSIDEVDLIDDSEVSEEDARQAGFKSRADLFEYLAQFGEAPLYRIRLHFAGPDPRKLLRVRETITDEEFASIRRRLARLDAASSYGPWTLAVLQIIRDRPEVRAASLAKSFGRVTAPFKIDVRKLKAMGLTESLEIGYRLSPRGRVLLDRLLQELAKEKDSLSEQKDA